MLQKHSNKDAVSLNSSALNNALSDITARFNLEGELTLENSLGAELNLADTLQQLKAQGSVSSVLATVFVPSQLVVLTEVFVPGSRKADWMAALPYALEESLSEPVENFHFVALNRSAQGLVSVAIIEHKWMKVWLQALELQGMSQALLVPECFRVPLQNQVKQADASLSAEKAVGIPSAFFQDAENALVRTSQFAGFSADANWLNQIKTVQVAHGHSAEMVEISRPQLLNSQHLAANLNGYNLRTELYRRQSKGLYYWQQWRWSALLLVLMLVFSLVTTWMASQKLAEQTAYTQAQTQSLFKKMFPDVKRIIDIRTQTMTRLNAQTASHSAGLSPMQVLGALDPLLKKVPEVNIKKITWRTTNQGSHLVLRVESTQTDQLQKVISLSKQTVLSGKIVLELKNVTPTLVEGVFNVTAK